MKKSVKKYFNPKEKSSIQQLFGNLRLKEISINLLPLKLEKKNQQKITNISKKKFQNGNYRVLLFEQV